MDYSIYESVNNTNCNKLYEHFGFFDNIASGLGRAVGRQGNEFVEAGTKNLGEMTTRLDVQRLDATDLAGTFKRSGSEVGEAGGDVFARGGNNAVGGGGVVGELGIKAGGKAPAAIKSATEVKAIGKAADTLPNRTLLERYPRLAMVGLTAAMVGVYAAVNGISFNQATKDLAKMTTEALKPIAEAGGNLVGTAAGAVIGGGVGAMGSGINALISSLTGIPLEYMPYVWYGIGGIVVLVILIKVYYMFYGKR